jgi:hypothetical protein
MRDERGENRIGVVRGVVGKKGELRCDEQRKGEVR